MPDELVELVSFIHDKTLEGQRITQELADAHTRLAALRNERSDGRPRSVEEHLLAIAPQEGFDINDVTDDDRRQIARVVLDAYLFGTSWLTRDPDHGFKREDPLRVEVRDRRMT